MLRARAADRPLLVCGTGAGKTTIAAEIIRLAVARGRRAVFLVHRRELVDQAVERLAQFGIRAGRILAGHPEHRELPVQVASIPTLLKRAHWPAELVIVDECAHAVSRSWRTCIDRYKSSHVIGLTATPIRLDGKGLGDLFGCIIEPVTTRQLIDAGYLIEPRVLAPPVDLSGIHIRGGDYDIPELAERMAGLVGSITGEWCQYAHGQKTVAFAVDVNHSKAIVAAFVEIGVRAEHVDYKMGHKQRAKVLRQLRTGEIDLLSQVQLLSEGWDLPTLQCAILARPTKSLALFRQMVGRVMRPPGPVIVLDHAGNHHEHGRVTDVIEWSLDAPIRGVRGAGTGIALHTCPACFCVLGPADIVCPLCGYVMPVKDEAEQPGVDNPGELVELDMARKEIPGVVQKNAPRDVKEEKYRELVLNASLRRLKLGWARHKFHDLFGAWPRFSSVEALYVCSRHEWEARQQGPYSVVRCTRCYANGTPANLAAHGTKTH